jgi:hypothetical protein
VPIRPLRWSVILLSLLLVPAHARACSQCLCGSPTPPGYLLGDISPGFDFGLEDRYLSKSNALEEGGSESQFEHRLSALVSYRPAGRLAMRALLPYVFKRNEATPFGGEEELVRSQGLGDAELLARLDVIRLGDGLSQTGAVALVGAVVVPTGSNRKRGADGERLDEHLQPGAGAWSGTLGLAFDRALPMIAFSASVLGRANSTNADQYHYGNALLYNVGVARVLTPVWEASLELNGRTAGRDWQTFVSSIPESTNEKFFDENTGGTIVYVTPSLRWTALGPTAISFGAQVPLLSALHGDQTERTNFRLSIGWSPR